MMAQEAKPTLHEIAAMPFPHSQRAMRQHYNKDWGKYSNEDLRSWKVSIEYSWRETGSEVFEVLAASEKDAISLAEDQFDDTCCEEDAEIDSIEAKEVS